MTKTKHKATPKVLLGIVAVLILFILTLAVYQVDSTEYVIVTQFGNPVRVVENPGLQIKLPDPIQSVQRLDTNLIHASVDPKTVQYLAGHENSKITMDIYAKVKYNKPDELAGAMAGAFALWDATV